MGTTVPTKHILATKLSDKTVLEFRGTAKLTESQSCFDFAGIAKKKKSEHFAVTAQDQKKRGIGNRIRYRATHTKRMIN